MSGYDRRKIWHACYKRAKTRLLVNGAWLQIAWHHGKRCLTAEVYVYEQPYDRAGPRFSQSRHFFADTSKDLIHQVRFALSQGIQDIHWDKKLMRRLYSAL